MSLRRQQLFSLAKQVGRPPRVSTADLLGLVPALFGSGVTLAIVLVTAAPKVSCWMMRAPRRNKFPRALGGDR